ncbi:unnamed protein product [Parnassius mnemosyne]|uniref:Reverse transcriptase domain-containing protein n=1 Tax=Parnassius mnemosyne TaxID=213953 RepID=A0AAV1LGS7_9NEOP
MSSITWSHTLSGIEGCGARGEHVQYFLETLNFCDLQQFNTVYNSYNRILDLVLSNDYVNVNHCLDPLVLEDQHHKALIIFVNFDVQPLTRNKLTSYSYNKGDYNQINLDISSVNWEEVLSRGNVDDAVELFYETIYNIRDKYIPSRIQCNSKYPPWFNHAIVRLIKEKNKYHKKFKIYGNLYDKITFEILRERIKRIEKTLYNEYICRVEDSLKSHSKIFWSYIRNKSRGASYPSRMTYSGITYNSEQDICNLFAQYFHSNYLQPTKPEDISRCTSSFASNDISTININYFEVERLLKSLDLKKSAGPDGIPALFLTKCAGTLSKPITFIFRRSINEGLMPSRWKSAFITPIHKKGPQNIIENYRPISKLNLIAKVFERIVYNQLYPAIKHTIIPQQHGFLQKRSTTSNLLLFTDFVSYNMDKGYQIDAIYTDYSKAFDRIDHAILMEKLSTAGIRGDLFRWFTSYISNRSQAVILNGFTSSWVPVPSGVPQGSLLGPLLFVIFINDISECFLNTNFLLFADDMKIFRIVNNFDDALYLQNDLLNLDNYCRRNKLDINVEKCFCVSFGRKRNINIFKYTLKGSELSRCNEIRDLGITIDNKLLYDQHIEQIVNKAYKALGFIIRSCSSFRNLKSIKILYCSLVRSNLEYASQIWNPQYNIYVNKIESIQKRFIRYVCSKFRIPKENYELLCGRLHLLPLQTRRYTADLVLLSKIAQGHIDCPDLLKKLLISTPTRSLRCNNLLHIPSYRTNYRRNSFFIRASNSFNRLSKDYDKVDLFCTNSSAICKLITSNFSNSQQFNNKQ